MTVRLVVKLKVEDASPSELRAHFVEEIHRAIFRAYVSGRIPLEIAEELRRAIPAKDQRQ